MNALERWQGYVCVFTCVIPHPLQLVQLRELSFEDFFSFSFSFWLMSLTLHYGSMDGFKPYKHKFVFPRQAN